MKDRKTVIESGMLELYLLGLLPDKQVAELEKMMSEDAVLKEKYTALEQDFENVSFENAIQPPDFIKEDLFASIQEEHLHVKKLPTEHNSETTDTGNSRVFMWLAAGLATIFMATSLWMFTEWNSAQENLQITQQELQTIKTQITDLQKNLQDSELLAQIVKDPNTKQYTLKGNAKIPDGFATAYINHQNKSAVVNVQQLPELPKDKTYQMWADVEGEMINMGVIDKEKNVVALQYIEDATSLNITIEPAGGSDHATVTQLVTNVYL